MEDKDGKNVYEMQGFYVHDRTTTRINGLLNIDVIGCLDAIVSEPLKGLQYGMEGSISILDDVMIIDVKETGKEDDVPSIKYFLEKDIDNPASAVFEGIYKGVRHNTYHTSDFDCDAVPTVTDPATIRKMVESIKVHGEKGDYAVWTLRRSKKNA